MSTSPAMTERFDAIVVGAGPAGSTAAFRLATDGASVLVLDRQRFPRDKPCGGGVTIRAARLLPFAVDPVVERVVDRIGVTMGHHGPRCDVVAQAPLVLMTQRRRLDHFLIEQAIAAGAQFRDAARVRGIDIAADGVVVHTDHGTVAAEVLVGADGANGVTRRALGAPEPSYAVALEGNLPRGGADFDDATYDTAALLEFDTVPGGYGWIFPKGDHCNFGVGGYLDEGPRLREHLAELCAAHGIAIDDLEHLRGHRLPIRRTGAPVATPRALLVGDAAGLVDPFSGDGIYEAVLSSKIAAETIADLLGGDARDLSAYPTRLGAALEPHAASAWVAKAVIEHAPGVMMGILRLPGATGIVAGRMRAASTEHSPTTRHVARFVGRHARRTLGPLAA
jgi:geranylgeranyl reductase family protein